jgi:uncharacterized membrane protein YhiD involved in acid resistance
LFQDQEPYLFSLGDVLLAMTVSALLVLVLANVYRATHRGTSFSQSYVHTLFVMGIATSVVMMIIGSNIARAFSLVGALSIIRFRTAVKDARDTGFLFAAIVVGMGCGTQFYMPAIGFTAFLSGLMLLLHFVQYGRKDRPDNIVRVTFRKDEQTTASVEEALRSAFRAPRLLNRILDLEKEFQTWVYAARVRDPAAAADFERRLRAVPGVVQVAIYERDQQEGEP